MAQHGGPDAGKPAAGNPGHGPLWPGAAEAALIYSVETGTRYVNPSHINDDTTRLMVAVLVRMQTDTAWRTAMLEWFERWRMGDEG